MSTNSPNNNDRRMQKRFKVEPGALVLETIQENGSAGAVTDISETGMSVICENDVFDLEQTLTSKILWAGGGCPVNEIGCVIKNKSKIVRSHGFWRKDKAYYRYGMSFVNVEEPRRMEIQTCINNHTIIEAVA